MTKVLLVEDHEELWDFLSRRLKRRGYEVILAHDGEAGVQQARAGQPDVILLDMNLPVLDGWSAARALKAGVEAARAERPDVILLDMNLPVMDGWTAARELRADPATARIPIIALTAHAMAGDKARTLEAGCDDYHPKPVDFSRLLSQIEEVLLGAEDKAAEAGSG